MAKLNPRWIAQPHGTLAEVADGLLTIEGSIIMPLGIPRRMTVIALKKGESVIWSPIPLREPEMAESRRLDRFAF